MREEFVSYVVGVCEDDAGGETLMALIDGLRAKFGTTVNKLVRRAPDRVRQAEALNNAARWIAYYDKSGCKSADEFCKDARRLPVILYTASHPATQRKMIDAEKQRRAIKVNAKTLRDWLKDLPTNAALQAKVDECKTVIARASSEQWRDEVVKRSAGRYKKIMASLPQTITMAEYGRIERELGRSEEAKALAERHAAKTKEMRAEVQTKARTSGKESLKARHQ